MKTTSLTDNPRLANSKDDFGIDPFEKGLIKFIENTSTPITIALQGEWGSGKTSLMNTLKNNLCDSESSMYFPIWINTWEYALMQDAQSTLLQIITKLVSVTTSIANPNSEKRNELLDKVKKVGVIATKFALNTGLGGGAGDVLNPFFESEKSSIGELRDELQIVINNAIKATDKKGFIFFIDDLDRIDPPVAVELLELLKNIFTLDKCVFILAIDYDVVVKGLKPKFGELTDKNEREFRSFFDKIIQVPFSMPVSSYKIDDFLKQKLFEIGYLNKEEALNTRLISNMAKITQLSVGSNPRAIKRLLNSLSLIKCINDAKNEKSEADEEMKLVGAIDLYVNFALVSIQIAYPKIYRLLNSYPDFTKWDESIAVQLNLKALDDTIKERLSKVSEFDENWEQILFRICETDHFLKQKALNISELLNNMKIEMMKSEKAVSLDDNEKINVVEEYVKRIIRLSAITNLEASDNRQVDYHASSLLKNVRNNLIATLKKTMPEFAKTIAPASARVQTNAPIAITKDMHINISSAPYKGQIRLEIRNHCRICKDEHNTIQEFFSANSWTDELKAIEKEYNSLANKFSHENYECYDSKKLLNSTFIYNNWIYFNLRFFIILPNVEDFVQTEFLKSMAEMVKGINTTYQKLIQYREKERRS
ncbi:KAP family NTPase [Parabacteroides sp. OttesenSCG-928-J18]|nr:KAP family NTPase [Parabacteroides sp. OttesenSCG-928-J18]